MFLSLFMNYYHLLKKPKNPKTPPSPNPNNIMDNQCFNQSIILIKDYLTIKIKK